MKINKKIFILLFITIVIIISILIGNRVSSNIDKFINYDEDKYMYTRFDLTVNLENKMITNITTELDTSKDRIEFLKSLKILEKSEFDDWNKKPNAEISVIIQDEKLFVKENFNYYYGNLIIYLEDNIVCLEEQKEINNTDYTIKKNML